MAPGDTSAAAAARACWRAALLALLLGAATCAAPDRTFSQSAKVGSGKAVSTAKGDSLVCPQPLFQIGDKTIRTFEDLAKYFSLYTRIPKIDTTEIVSVDVIGAPCGPFAANATFYLRAGTHDLRMMKTAFGSQSQLTPLLHIFSKAPPRRVLHLGAHTGMATMFFALNFPGADVVAIEPELNNYAMLRLNTAPYARVVTDWGAAWDRSVTVKLDRGFRGRSLWQRFVVDILEMSTGRLGDIVPAMHVGDLMRKLNWTAANGGLDLVHADMEGAEKVVIADAGAREWLKQVKCVSMKNANSETAAAVINTLTSMEPVKFVRKSSTNKHLLSVWCRADAGGLLKDSAAN